MSDLFWCIFWSVAAWNHQWCFDRHHAFLYRDDYYDSASEDKNVAECIVAKNRHGSTGTVKMGWVGKYTKFRTLVDEGQAPS